MIAIFGQCLLYLILLNNSAIIMASFKQKFELHQKLVSSLLFLSVITVINLIYAFIVSDFSVLLVYLHSHTLKPLLYKIGGAWGNHEGSLLLMTLVINIYLWVFNKYTLVDAACKQKVSSVNAIINLFIVSYIIFLNNPFELNLHQASNGLGLNPLLQDVGLMIHPPILYCGYMGFVLSFCVSIYALRNNNHSPTVFRLLRNFVLVAWSFLTLGIILGSWWAYRELGWGGFWFWDPVENVSLMPWFIATALLHTVILAINKNILQYWVHFLSMLAFIASILGSFLVRSGVVTSVHSFAADPTKGVGILCFLIIIVIFSLYVLFKAQLKRDIQQPHIEFNFKLLSREMSILINNLLMVIAFIIIVFATLYPIGLNLVTGQSITVGNSYFNNTLGSIFIVVMLACGLSHSLSWRVSKMKAIISKNMLSIMIASLVAFLIIHLYGQVSFAVVMGIFSSSYLVCSSLYFLILNKTKLPFLLAHLGFGVLLLGAIISVNYETAYEDYIKIGDEIKIHNKTFILEQIKHEAGPNYFCRVAKFKVSIDDYKIIYIYPESRLYPVEGSITSDSDVYHSLKEDIYISISELKDEQYLHVRIYNKPLISLLWLGGLIILIGAIKLIFIKFNVVI
ncbi:heme lyase CcmF/NrfE family subunit [Rickettsiales endosymbiont of Stachyamoeba lipophora]|uniref:heme lyase CcmF/NrfE family subunit n=1 Tax=Rickettsiales endosymbiont of Stachyamoeba lipophora TaxID=2486578 RepID=UPI000F64F27F|nr:heme lyase CcmF/NrfE family subunit [Rickettsiales endosymbiont of Stachyamoeba lipophora]AZL16049.1 heme lyase CcmF/NrfE family subunit [Rickettsiales endosymbiont of Stachyamoeba lipophora]